VAFLVSLPSLTSTIYQQGVVWKISLGITAVIAITLLAIMIFKFSAKESKADTQPAEQGIERT
jgi:hypothetical protein